jgi:dienelactone hydrolase
LPKDKIRHEVNLKRYSGAYHGFDAPGMDVVIVGHRNKHNAMASADAIVQVRGFLAKYLK